MAYTYSGTSYATWNVILWIDNDEGLYHMAREYRRQGYKAFAESLREIGIIETPDRVSYSDTGLDIDALDAHLRAEEQ